MKGPPLVVLLALAACSTSSPPPAAPADPLLQRQMQAGSASYELERPDQAAARYREALQRAQARDDPAAIGDLGYDLAVAELQANAPDRALAAARATRQELERRGIVPFPALLLAEATALYRCGSLGPAEAMASRVRAGSDPTAAARATFLVGMIADDRGDTAGLSAAAAALSSESAAPSQGDAAELATYLALRQGDWPQARREAARAAALRQSDLDYRGMSRALAAEGEAARHAGDMAAAADLYLRAGRSASIQGDRPAARRWLAQAAALAPGQAAGRDAERLLADLGQDTAARTSRPDPRAGGTCPPTETGTGRS
jgi:tetratricopeptide (TPR) repeat protein